MAKIFYIQNELEQADGILDEMLQDLDEVINMLLDEKEAYIKDKQELHRILALYSSNKEIK